MEFGVWVQKNRQQRGLDIRTFAEKTGVDPSTISRIEHLNTQATLYTAFRVCESFNVSLPELMKTLDGNYPSSLEQKDYVKEGTVATLDDLENFINSFRLDEEGIRRRIVVAINSLIHGIHINSTRENKNGLSPFMPEDVDKLLFNSPIYQFGLKYPSRIKADAILYIYERKGALTLPDIEVYIRKMRPGRVKTFGRMDTASLERVKLSDVLLLDNDTKENGRIVAMYWEVCKFHDRFNSSLQRQRYEADLLFEKGQEEREEWEFKLASIYITIYRWLQYLNGREAYADISL
jgi:transcriptional regulator with XRE-family HTH domain